MSLNVGDTIGDYQVIGILGAGGMGKVYKVRNVISDRIEAMKILLPNLESDLELADRFLREIKVQASLDHPNIAALHTAQRVGNQLLMLMEFVEGETLESVQRRGPIPLENGVDAVSQVLAALAYAHAHGVVHRDIKPANMMLTPQGVVKLMDFGIAKAAADRKLTQTGRTVGSLYYMSPEQINGAANLDARSDLYSLGVALYEMVTGRRPFQGDSDYSIMAAHLQSMPVPPIQLDPRVPAPLNDIILTAIAKDPGQRFQSADAFRTALETVMGQLRGYAPAYAPPQPAYAPPQPEYAPPPPEASYGAPPPYMPPPPQAPAQGSGRRVLYMVAGSLATIAILVVAATQIPKWRAARAGSDQAPAQTQTQNQPAAAPSEAPQPAPAAQAEAPPVTQPGAPAATQQVSQPTSSAPQRGLARPAAVPAASSMREQPVAAPVRQSEPPPPQQAQPQQAAPQGPDPAKQAELSALRERMMLMATRLVSAKASVENMRRVQAASGLGMRQDVMTSMQRAEYYMDESERGIKSGDAAGARRTLDSAEREIERLEKFLGR